FAKATEATTDLAILSLAVEFFSKIGQPDNAGKLVRRQAAIARDRTIAARHYFSLLPLGFVTAAQRLIVTQMVAQFPSQVAEELCSIADEFLSDNRFEEFMIATYVKHLTTGELVEMARHLGSAEGQSVLQKQPAIMKECGEFGSSEFVRLLQERHPEW